ncbi:MAG: hypothetical protein N2747_07875 [Chitinophagaceae bacterium]|nr:hypothetical protein [Chitinophagaceae bacterium]
MDDVSGACRCAGFFYSLFERIKKIVNPGQSGLRFALWVFITLALVFVFSYAATWVIKIFIEQAIHKN